MTVSETTLRALEIMRNSGLDIFEIIIDRSLIVNIFYLPVPQEYQYQFRPSHQPEILPGDFFYVDRAPAAGMHIITEFPIYQLTGDILIQSDTGEAGTALSLVGTVYRGPLAQYDQAISRAVNQVEQMAGYSFTAPADITDYRAGENDSILLPRIPINHLVSVLDLNDCPIDLSLIEVDHASGTLLMKRGDWPRRRLKITANYGFTDYPDEVLEAIALIGSNSLSMEDASGNIMSRSAEGYSESLGPGGVYGAALNSNQARAMSLLGPYCTGVV
jgi:hypothetical protein